MQILILRRWPVVPRKVRIVEDASARSDGIRAMRLELAATEQEIGEAGLLIEEAQEQCR